MVFKAKRNSFQLPSDFNYDLLGKTLKKGYETGEIVGWQPDPDADSLFADQRRDFTEYVPSYSFAAADEPVVLSDFVIKVLGSFPVHRQTIGDCVSHGWSSGIDVLKCVEIVLKGENEEFKAEVATEVTYGGSREIVGQTGRWDGSNGSWASKYVTQVGTCARIVYNTSGGEFDLTTYNGQKARGWARSGVPDALDEVAKEHPVKTSSLVTTFEAAAEAIKNGYPVPVCSGYGFSSTRDSQGFASQRGSWSHCMLFLGVRWDRPGLLCLNSWGTNWNGGPKTLNQPDGSFWVDERVVNKMLGERDSFAISNFVGYPSRDLNYVLI